MDAVPDSAADADWGRLYTTGGVAALLGAAIVPLQMAAFLAWPPPGPGAPVTEWFTLLQNNAFRGLLNLDLLYLVSWILLIPVLLALYAALRPWARATMTIATAVGFVAIVVFCTSIVGAEMLRLSHDFAAATTDADRTIVVAAGQAMLARYQGTPFHVSLILGAAAFAAISVVMLRSPAFGNFTAWLGIVGNALSLGFYVPGVGIWLLSASVLPLFGWLLLVGLALLRLGRGSGP